MTKLTQFSLPVPAGTKISSEYGPRFNKKGQEKTHQGIDFAVVSNTKIYSVGSGTVIRTIANHKDFGNVVIVKHADDQATLYAHLNEFKVSEEDVVDESTILGLSGNTGRSDGPHLHFEVIEGSNYVSIIDDTQGTSVGIYNRQGRFNPRQYFQHYTDAEFSATVVPGSSSFGITSGDNRDNIIYGNSRQNTLEGLEGEDTYYFPSLSGADQIIDSNFDGVIYIEGVELSSYGTAHSKFSSSGEVIEGQWSLGLYSLMRKIVLFLTLALFSASAFAGDLTKTKNAVVEKTENVESEVLSKVAGKSVNETASNNLKNPQLEAQDPDLQLSIEELREKYPINWLEEKYENYFEGFCEGGDGDGEYTEYELELKLKVVCQFFANEEEMMNFAMNEPSSNHYERMKPKEIKTIFSAEFLDVFSLSEAQIKSVIINDKIYVEPRSQDILKILLNDLSNKNFHHHLKSKIIEFMLYEEVRKSLTMGCDYTSEVNTDNKFYEIIAINFLEKSKINSLIDLDKKIKICLLNKYQSTIREIFLKKHPEILTPK